MIDGGELPPGNHVVPPDGLHGVTLLDLPARWDELEDPTRLRIQFEDDPAADARAHPVLALRLREEPIRARADQCSVATAEAFARRLTPLHTIASGIVEPTSGEIAGPSDFMELLALGDVHSFDPELAWRPRPARDRLRVPIGLGEGGSLVHLDIKESAQQGMGPHGLVIGATGSGKSEFLRTLVLGLAMTHSPEQLNMVLVDFKGGATFAGMSELPHVSAVITNLAQELTLVDRMQDALSGEMVRRQELLREAGNFASIRDYEKARAAGEDLAPMPSLFVVVDEFSEMLSAKPEFIDLFVAIGRLGRSLGLHLLLASQRLEEGRLRGLESHLSYRVGLRTFSASESRSVLGVPDAYELPADPGLGYLKPDPSTMLRFKSAYVSGPPTGRTRVRRDEGGHVRGILPFTISEVQSLEIAEPDPEPVVVDEPGDTDSLLDDRRRPHDRPRSRRPPGLAPAARRARHPRRPDGRPDRRPAARPGVRAVAPAGRAGRAARHGRPAARAAPRHAHHRPRRRRRSRRRRRRAPQRQEHGAAHGRREHVADHDAAGVAVLRARLRRRHVLAVHRPPARRRCRHPRRARRRTPDRRRGARRRRPSRGLLPRQRHRLDRDLPLPAGGRAGPTTATATSSSSSTAGARCAPTSTTSRPRSSSSATRGLTFGLHVVVGAARWADFRAAMRDLFGTRLELRLGDPMDSEIDRKIAALVPAGRAGRGLVQGKLHFLAALPRIDGGTDTDTLGDGVDDLIKQVTAAWEGPTGPKLRLLPERIDLDQVRELGARRATARAAGRRQREGPRRRRARRRRRAAPAGLRRRTVRQERAAAHLRAAS